MNRYTRSWAGLMEQCKDGEWVKHEDVVALVEHHTKTVEQHVIELESYYEDYKEYRTEIKDLEYRLEDALQDKANYRLVSKLVFFALIFDVFASIAMRWPW